MRRLPLPALLGCALLQAALLGCGPDPLVFSPTALPDATVGRPYDVTIAVSQTRTPVGGAGVMPGTLPPGLELKLSEAHDNTMHLAGTPTGAGTFHFTVSVWCYGTQVSGQTGARDYVLVVK